MEAPSGMLTGIGICLGLLWVLLVCFREEFREQRDLRQRRQQGHDRAARREREWYPGL